MYNWISWHVSQYHAKPGAKKHIGMINYSSTVKNEFKKFMHDEKYKKYFRFGNKDI